MVFICNLTFKSLTSRYNAASKVKRYFLLLPTTAVFCCTTCCFNFDMKFNDLYLQQKCCWKHLCIISTHYLQGRKTLNSSVPEAVRPPVNRTVYLIFSHRTHSVWSFALLRISFANISATSIFRSINHNHIKQVKLNSHTLKIN